MPTPPENLLPILQDCYKPRESGWMWVLMWQDGDDAGLVNEITGDYETPDRADALAGIINTVGPDQTWIALCRQEAQPLERDREFWRRLRTQVDTAILTDMVVFNRREVWSMRAEDAAASAAS